MKDELIKALASTMKEENIYIQCSIFIFIYNIYHPISSSAIYICRYVICTTEVKHLQEWRADFLRDLS